MNLYYLILNKFVKISTRKNNYRMAKTTKWLNAILDYIKKVRLSISMVPPSHANSIDMLTCLYFIPINNNK